MSILEFEQIYAKYERELYAFIYSIARRDSFASEDILQNTMISAYKYLHTLHEKEKLKSWLFAIAKNESSRYYAKKVFGMEIQTDNIEDIGDKDKEMLVEPDFSAELISNKDFIFCISNLNQETQSVMFLRYKFGLSLKEIAEIWNINYNTIKTIHFRGIKKLKESFAEKGYEV